MFNAQYMMQGGSYEDSDNHLQTCTGYEGSDWRTTHLNVDSYPYHVSTSFELPIDSRTLFLLARGALSSGVVSFATSNILKDAAQVDVTVGYYRQSALERVKICSTTRSSGENGVSLLVSASIMLVYVRTNTNVDTRLQNNGGVVKLTKTAYFTPLSSRSLNIRLSTTSRLTYLTTDMKYPA
jgi:hypothetical protein